MDVRQLVKREEGLEGESKRLRENVCNGESGASVKL